MPFSLGYFTWLGPPDCLESSRTGNNSNCNDYKFFKIPLSIALQCLCRYCARGVGESECERAREGPKNVRVN